MGRPRKGDEPRVDPYVFFEVSMESKDGDKRKDRVKCLYCNYEVLRKWVRCMTHCVRCPQIPTQAKLEHGFVTDEYLTEDSEGEKRVRDNAPIPTENKEAPKTPGRTTGRKRKPSAKAMTDMSDLSDDDMFNDEPKRSKPKVSNSRKNETVKLFTDFLEDLGMNASTLRSKKKFHEYTEDDWKKEERELAVREARSRIRMVDAQTDMMRAKEQYYQQMPQIMEPLARLPELLEPISRFAQVMMGQNCATTVVTTEPHHEPAYTIVPHDEVGNRTENGEELK